MISGHIPGENMQNLGVGGTKQPIFNMVKFELEVEREMYPPLRLHKGYYGLASYTPALWNYKKNNISNEQVIIF